MKYVLFLSLPLFILDQVTKLWIHFNLPVRNHIPVIENFFNLVHVHNSGMAFGILNGNPYSNYLFGGIALFAIIGITILWRKDAFPTKLGKVSVALLIAGIFGNVTDRIAHGHVIDFLDFRLPFYDKISPHSGGHFPSFNVADSCICIAAALLIFASFKSEAQKSTTA